VEKYLKAGKIILIPPIETAEAVEVWGEKELSTRRPIGKVGSLQAFKEVV